MDEFEQSDLEKETLTTFSINMRHIIKRKCFHEKRIKCGIYSLVFVIQLGDV